MKRYEAVSLNFCPIQGLRLVCRSVSFPYSLCLNGKCLFRYILHMANQCAIRICPGPPGAHLWDKMSAAPQLGTVISAHSED